MENFKRKVIDSEAIETFLNGHDSQERIVNIEYNYKDDFIKLYYRDDKDRKCMSMQPFYPFVWARLNACLALCNGNRHELITLMRKYKIAVKELSIKNNNGEDCEEMRDGYRYMFYATQPMSYQTFLDFFKKAKFPIYQDKNDKVEKKMDRPFLCVTPQEQYLISTGKRFFKGYEDYNDLLRMIFDLETEGLDAKKDRIKLNGIRLNRPVTIDGVTYEKFEKIFRIKGKTKEELDKSELKVIDTMFRIIYTFKPDIITAHNGENFDWAFIIERCNQLGTSIQEVTKPYFKGASVYKNTKETILKLGGEVETFHQTVVPGIVVTDSLHAVRRAQATDSNFLKGDLKYATKYLEMVKPNRVYVPGEIIDKILIDEEKHYAFNNENGDWYIYDPNYIEQPKKEEKPEHDLKYFEDLLYEDRHKVYTEQQYIEEFCDGEFEDSYGTVPPYEEIKKIAEEPKYDSSVTAEDLYNEYLESLKPKKNITDKFVLVTRNTILDGYVLVSGKYIVERYLLDDLWECDMVEAKLNATNFLICKMLPIPFQKCCTMGTAGQWKSLMMAWSYENDLAIPYAGNTGKFTGGLSRLLSTGYVNKVAKFDYNSLYPSIIITWAIEDEKDISGATLKFLEHMLTNREKYKKIKKGADTKVKEYKEIIKKKGKLTKEQGIDYNKQQAIFASADKIQTQMKVFANSFFGAYGSNVGSVYPWKSVKCAERTTCTGRQSLRLMISHFSKLGYKPIVGDTDGFNFKLPDESKYRYTKEHPYVSVGLSRETKEGKEYTGYEADVAEFNDKYMKDFHYAPKAVNKMGLGIDEIVDSTINFSRKNYADYFPDEAFPKDVKLVGNTIKSKKMPEYISKFLEKGVRLLLQNKGKEFLDEYYTYIGKIYNYQIPLKQIASKGKVKKSIEDYKKDCETVTKAGNKKSRQAWMELAIREGLKVDLGETLYFINTGTKKSHSDVKRVTSYNVTLEDGTVKNIKSKLDKEWKAAEDGKNGTTKKLSFDDWVKKHHREVSIETEIILCCELLPREIVESDNDYFCEEGKEYNVEKYIEQFNKRITPLLVCFSKEIRPLILITNPKDRQYFTDEQSILVSGQPNKDGDQDTYEQLMTMEDKEIRFWMAHPEWEIPFLKECDMDWEKIKTDYLERMEREKQLGIDKIREQYDDALNKLTEDEVDKFEDDGKIPSNIEKLVTLDPVTNNFMSKEYPDVIIGTMYDIMDAYEFIVNNKNTKIEEAIEYQSSITV